MIPRFFLLALFSGSAAATPTTLTMEEAVERAVRTHPEALASEAAQQAAHADKNASRGRLLPAVNVSDMQNWSHVNLHGLADQVGGNGERPAFLAPNAQANLLSVGARQPLSGLLARGHKFAAAKADLRAAKAATQATRRNLALQVRQQYLALFQARAMADTARASERALCEQVEDAEHKYAAGALASSDVLRPRAAAAAAKQRVLAAQASEQVARAYLLELVGLADATWEVTFAEPSRTSELHVPHGVQALRAQAMQHRPELHQAHAQSQAAALQARAQRLALLPQIDAQLAWMHLLAGPNTQGRTAPKAKADVYYVGLSASWPIWQWGAQYFDHRAAYARASQAREQAAATERRVGAEVAQRHANLLACLGAVDAAVAETSSAEEAYRVMVATLAVDAATTSDLLQTEAAQTQARMNLVRARYDLALAKVALDYALGTEG